MFNISHRHGVTLYYSIWNEAISCLKHFGTYELSGKLKANECTTQNTSYNIFMVHMKFWEGIFSLHLCFKEYISYWSNCNNTFTCVCFVEIFFSVSDPFNLECILLVLTDENTVQYLLWHVENDQCVIRSLHHKILSLQET